jgi:cysteinyl-tRNA synthetase
VDLLFPHHENEIAQSECCNGVPFASHWYHSEHLLVDGKKMSKSLGNLYTLDQLKEMGHSPMALRYSLLAGHPRKQLNFTLDSLHAAYKNLVTLKRFRLRLAESVEQGHPSGLFATCIAHLQNDLNTPAALGELFSTVNSHEFSQSKPGDLESLDELMNLLGLDLRKVIDIRKVLGVVESEIPAAITALAEKRWAAKQAKDWPAADALRAEIAAAGWTMKDRKDGYDLLPA